MPNKCPHYACGPQARISPLGYCYMLALPSLCHTLACLYSVLPAHRAHLPLRDGRVLILLTSRLLLQGALAKQGARRVLDVFGGQSRLLVLL